ncbi:MAG: head GIN domain-containing protein [Allosphingosinicella sp.]|uniref:head GIN domain-containing protein n=1 Tax=Allosphingosinicella sp. TaxID=2823234 RepID=UPI003943B872
MLRSLAALFVLFIAALGAGAAAAADRRYAVQDFDRIVVEGPFQVRLVTGRSTSASAQGSQHALDGVVVDVQGTTLRVRRNQTAWTGAPSRPVAPATVTLSTRVLRSARVVGSGQLDIAGLAGQRIDLVVQGSGRLVATGIEADNLSVGLSGSGSMQLAGTAETFTADLQGSGSLVAPGLSVETGTVSAVTTGDVALHARREITVNANGLGTIVIAGRPACTVRGPGAAEVRCGGDR